MREITEDLAAILTQVRMTTALIGGLEQAADEKIKALGRRIRLEQLHQEREETMVRRRLLTQLKMITALVALRTDQEEEKWRELAGYVRAMIALRVVSR